MDKILIIKLGALGDVIRTTPILRSISGEVSWVTKRSAFELLPSGVNKIDVKDILSVDDLINSEFDLVLGLDEEIEALGLASDAKNRAIGFIGAYLDEGQIRYTVSSESWFDMSLSSRFGKARADELKKENTLSYQEHLFQMVGKKFKSEEYLTDFVPNDIPRKIIGIEARAGEVWPAKRWQGYSTLAQKLEERGYEVRIFEQRPTLKEYTEEINQCGLIIAGDTLAMHLALALKKPTVAIFTCTPPQEIYGYERLTKVVSPVLNEHFYSRKAEGVDFKISVDEVLKAVESAGIK